MLSAPEKLESQAFLLIRVWSVLLLFSVIFGNGLYAVAKSNHSPQEIGITERRQAEAQNWTFAREGVEYVMDLPSASWHAVSRVDVHEHVEFVNGNEVSGYLRLSKILVDVDTTAANLFQKDEKWNLQHLPGYVGECNGEPFRGHFSGATLSYEYTSGGRTMSGRVYYLQIDKRTFYALRFTVAQDKLQGMARADRLYRSKLPIEIM